MLHWHKLTNFICKSNTIKGTLIAYVSLSHFTSKGCKWRSGTLVRKGKSLVIREWSKNIFTKIYSPKIFSSKIFSQKYFVKTPKIFLKKIAKMTKKNFYKNIFAKIFSQKYFCQKYFWKKNPKIFSNLQNISGKNISQKIILAK